MSTKREAILSQLITQLAGTTGVGTRIYRSRVTPVSRSEGHVLIVEPVSESVVSSLLLNNCIPTQW